MENEVTVKEGNVRISMSWDGINEKNLDEMTDIIENLLYAAGYRLKGQLEIVDG